MSEDRAALYYPYIHIRSEHWLKATLLTFPKVYRMVPLGQYFPEDDPTIIPYTGDSKHCLLDNVNTADPAARDAQRQLLKELKKNEKTILSRYQQDPNYPLPLDKYLLHDQKLDDDLREYLLTHNLAWPDNDFAAKGQRNWLGLHPLLGSAIMSSLGLTLADQYGHDIVTNSTADHETLISTETSDIIDRLLGNKHRPNPPEDRDTATHLGQLIINRTINLDAISIDDIRALHDNKKTRKEFIAFKEHLAGVAETIGPVADPKTREERLKAKAKDTIDAWHAYQATLPIRIANALIDVSDLHAPELFAPVLTGAATLGHLHVATGVSVSFIAYGALRIYREYQKHKQSPYRYLSTIAAAQDPRTLLAFPLGLHGYTTG
jgi:hypothetical protein